MDYLEQAPKVKLLTAAAALIFLLLALPARAHPVAQGAMDITVHEDRLTIHARVTNEQAFVADALGNPSTDDSGGLPALLARHGKYLLEHVYVVADAHLLQGRLGAITPPTTSTLEGRIGYELSFPFPETLRRPREVKLRQDVLNEFEFAPGNRWEATYVVSIRAGTASERQGLLFTSREALLFQCDWSPSADTAQPPQLERAALFSSYLRHGFLHIFEGYDHLLFMAALVLAVVSFLDLVKVVTAFTVAHTITLTLSVFDVVRLPTRIVEPMIAASIIVVALQNIFWPRQTHGWARLGVAFGFGLFHGLGFAGGLLEAMAGLPTLAVVLAIAAFSIGVELGHQVVVLPVYAALQLARRQFPPRESIDVGRMYAVKLGSAAICAGGLVYFVAAVRA